MSELKCCPFCGGEAKVCDDIEYTVGGYYVECKDCHIQTPSKIKGKEAVIKYWNTRKPMANIVDKLEELKNEDVCMETSCTECKEKYKNNSKKDCYEPIQKLVLDKAINIVKQEINKEN